MGPDGAKWHEGVPAKASFELLKQKGDETLATLSLSTLEDGIAAVVSAKGNLEMTMKGAGKVVTTKQSYIDAKALAESAVVTKAEKLLLHHIATETNKEHLKGKIKEDVKSICSYALGEKQVLHAALYKHAWSFFTK